MTIWLGLAVAALGAGVGWGQAVPGAPGVSIDPSGQATRTVAPAAGTIAVPAGQRAVLVLQARGSQIYHCDKVDGRPAWVFDRPEADLFADGPGQDGGKVGTHGAGPVWLAYGGIVKGKVVQTVPSRDPQAVPWLLLQASEPSGKGPLASATYIERSATRGGKPLAEECTKARLGAVSRMPYFATYTFFAAGQ